MDSDAPYLPEEILTNILSRLPVKSLIRFQCVCKDWKNLFKTPSFMAEHVLHSTQQDSLLLLKSPGYKCNPEYVRLIHRDMQVLEYQTPPSSVRQRDIIGSSNGLVCLILMYKSSFILWNPATREVLRVPKAPNLYHTGICDLGFGFSPIVNDYKIVLLSLSSLDDDGVYLVQVFSVSKWSWKEVEVGKLKGMVSFVAPGFSFDGAIFWFGFGCKPRFRASKRFLISFDIATESFALITIPKSSLTSESRLTTYDNKLAMLSKSRVESTESFSIKLWVMEKRVGTSRKRWTWRKIYTSNPFPDRTYFLRSLTIWRNEIVIVGVTGGETVLVFCNLHTNEFKMLTMGKYSIGTVISAIS
ncbi:hypothetical protein QN277_009039 [Acacia crassicarpa]|uniref:F-box domain-containing protein n=1 Tax=Acacia crassicarpa TaxID=499986 RepID=A0AAE1IRG6_9FABA|nr:hypothetical protein QN277_009039 [Acacia crassicarpa]